MKVIIKIYVLYFGICTLTLAELPDLKRVAKGTWKVISKDESNKRYDGTAFAVYENYFFTAHHVIFNDQGHIYQDVKLSLIDDDEKYQNVAITSAVGLCDELKKGTCKKGFDAALIRADIEAQAGIERFELTFNAKYAKYFHGMPSGFRMGTNELSHSNYSGFSIVNVYKDFPLMRNRIDMTNPYYYRGFSMGARGLSGGPVFNLEEDHKVSSIISLSKDANTWSQPIFTVSNIALVKLLDKLPLSYKLEANLINWNSSGHSYEQSDEFLKSLSNTELYKFADAVINIIESNGREKKPTKNQLYALYDSLHLRRIDYVRERLANYVDVSVVPGWQRDLAKNKNRLGQYYAAIGEKEVSKIKFSEAINLLTNYMSSSYDLAHYGRDVYNDSLKELKVAYQGLGNENLVTFYTQVGAYSGSPTALLAAGERALTNGNLEEAVDFWFTATLTSDDNMSNVAGEKLKRVLSQNPILKPLLPQHPNNESFNKRLQKLRKSLDLDGNKGKLNGTQVNVKEAVMQLSPASVREEINAF